MVPLTLAPKKLPARWRYLLTALPWTMALVVAPTVLAFIVLGLHGWDLTVPLIYRNSDDIWQLALTKMLSDTGWVLTNPFLGAPGVAHWHHNAAAQTSALHSVLMLGISRFVSDPVAVQQIYYLLNFPLIALTSFFAGRLVGLAKLPAFCIGLLYAFTTFRIEGMLYAFLANYFMIPLALVAVIWILSGRYAKIVDTGSSQTGAWQSIRHLVSSKPFLLGLGFITLTAASDGYYAFFTLLLLGFAGFIRLLLGDWRRPVRLLPVVTFITTLLAVSLALQIPLKNYMKSHTAEFYPNGVLDSALTKHPFEAEVYSTTLKMMIAPIQQHSVTELGDLGKWMVATSDAARKYKNGRTLVPLGTLASLALFVSFALLAMPRFRRAPSASSSKTSEADVTLGDTLLALVLFIFLTSILGGIGTLIALEFPTIRGYDRFPLFLIFVLYLGAGYIATIYLHRGQPFWKRTLTTILILFITGFALFDQIPLDAKKGEPRAKQTFLAERAFVRRIESVLPPGAMVYQYPYSQYLRENEYYGWGSFSHIRLYLHSHSLRWSNGGAKNSPTDDWNFRISTYPIEQLVPEIRAVGFRGLVIDRGVLKKGEYAALRQKLVFDGYNIREDPASKLTFVALPDPGYKVVYDQAFKNADRLIVTDRNRVLAQNDFAGLVEGVAFKNFLASDAGRSATVILRTAHPEIIAEKSVIERGRGNAPISPLTDVQGKMVCGPSHEFGGESVDGITFVLRNQSDFDWQLGEGRYPLRIGVHMKSKDGQMLRWDDGFRVPTHAYIKRGNAQTINLRLDALPLGAEIRSKRPLIAEFALVQDGNAWFANVACQTALP